jgi:hypothetical protein
MQESTVIAVHSIARLTTTQLFIFADEVARAALDGLLSSAANAARGVARASKESQSGAQRSNRIGIVTLISGRWRRSHLVDAPHHATHQAHVSCRQTLNASERIAR